MNSYPKKYQEEQFKEEQYLERTGSAGGATGGTFIEEPKSPIDHSINTLKSNIDELERCIGLLRGRLHRVMVPALKNEVNEKRPDEPVTLSEIINIRAYQIKSINNQVNEIIDSLEL